MADTFKIIDGPSEMDIMWALTRKQVVTFEVETTKGDKKREMYLDLMSSSRSAVTAAFTRHAGLNPRASLLRGVSRPIPGVQTRRFYMAFQIWNRLGVLSQTNDDDMGGRLHDPLEFVLGDLILDTDEWRSDFS